MAREQISGDVLPLQINVGLSALVGVTGLPGQMSVSLQYIAGGSLEIVSLGASIGWGSGWPIPASSIVTIDTGGTVWLASSGGATTIVAVLRARSQGFEGASLGFGG